MNNKPKIFVLQLKEVIYTAMFILLAILFILLIFWMFSSKDSQESTNTPADNTNTTQEAKSYTSGIYHSCITLNNTPLELEVTVDPTNIKSIHFANLSESISTLYPLLEECVANLEEQICLSSSLDEITYPEDEQYASLILMEGIRGALAKAE